MLGPGSLCLLHRRFRLRQLAGLDVAHRGGQREPRILAHILLVELAERPAKELMGAGHGEPRREPVDELDGLR